jgi:hypothetical protein
MSKKNKWMAIIAGIAVPAVLVFAYATGPDPGTGRQRMITGMFRLSQWSGGELQWRGSVVSIQSGQLTRPGAANVTIVITTVARVYGSNDRSAGKRFG